ncbi:MAG: MBL fold metallo-hydrolase [Acidobacteriota bacterium]
MVAVTFCTLGSGSRGNATLVQTGRTNVLIDIGFSARETARRLATVGVAGDAIDAILLTHEHGDHVAGAVVASRGWRVPIVCRPAVAGRLGLASANIFGVQSMPMEPFAVGDFTVTPFPVPHDAVETVGFVLEAQGIRIGYATDLGHVTPEVSRRLKGCHLVALEANHDVELTRAGPYPWSLKQRILGEHGHLSNHASAQLLSGVVGPETSAVVLTHLSATNNAPHLALMEAREALEEGGNGGTALQAAGQIAPVTPIVL